jgi:hypothetical protein
MLGGRNYLMPARETSASGRDAQVKDIDKPLVAETAGILKR